MLRLIIDNKNVGVSFDYTFKDGGVNCLIAEIDRKQYDFMSLSVDPRTPVVNVMLEIKLVLDALEAMNIPRPKKRLLRMPYLPHARADRVFKTGNSRPLHMFLKELAMCDFDSVSILDPHNESALQNYGIKWEIVTQAKCFVEKMMREIPKENFVIVSPDKGAAKKIDEVAHAIAERGVDCDVVQADKVRNTDNYITDTTIPEYDYKDKVCMIIDDICDGGRTFIPLARLLKEAGAKRVELFVTHGIFSNGLVELGEFIDRIHCYEIIGKFVTDTDLREFNESQV